MLCVCKLRPFNQCNQCNQCNQSIQLNVLTIFNTNANRQCVNNIQYKCKQTEDEEWVPPQKKSRPQRKSGSAQVGASAASSSNNGKKSVSRTTGRKNSKTKAETGTNKNKRKRKKGKKLPKHHVLRPYLPTDLCHALLKLLTGAPVD